MFLNPGWATRDHVIPWRLFWLMHHCLNEVLALDRVSMARAIADADGFRAAPEGSGLGRPLQEDLRVAFPWRV